MTQQTVTHYIGASILLHCSRACGQLKQAGGRLFVKHNVKFRVDVSSSPRWRACSSIEMLLLLLLVGGISYSRRVSVRCAVMNLSTEERRRRLLRLRRGRTRHLPRLLQLIV